MPESRNVHKPKVQPRYGLHVNSNPPRWMNPVAWLKMLVALICSMSVLLPLKHADAIWYTNEHNLLFASDGDSP